MDQVDPEILADHLDAVLTCTPHRTVLALANAKAPDRLKATRDIALLLAERVQKFGSVREPSESGTPRLFD